MIMFRTWDIYCLPWEGSLLCGFSWAFFNHFLNLASFSSLKIKGKDRGCRLMYRLLSNWNWFDLMKWLFFTMSITIPSRSHGLYNNILFCIRVFWVFFCVLKDVCFSDTVAKIIHEEIICIWPLERMLYSQNFSMCDHSLITFREYHVPAALIRLDSYAVTQLGWKAAFPNYILRIH